MSEQLVLDQINRYGPAVHRDKRFGGARAQMVDGSREQFFSRAGFSADEHAGSATGDGGNFFDLSSESRTLTNQLREAKLLLEPGEDRVAPPVAVSQPPKTGNEVNRAEWRRDKIGGARIEEAAYYLRVGNRAATMMGIP